MQANCPNCNTKFSVDPKIVSRRARCNKCSHVWRVATSNFDHIEPVLQILDEVKPLVAKPLPVAVRNVVTVRPRTSFVTWLVLLLFVGCTATGLYTTATTTPADTASIERQKAATKRHSDKVWNDAINTADAEDAQPVKVSPEPVAKSVAIATEPAPVATEPVAKAPIVAPVSVVKENGFTLEVTDGATKVIVLWTWAGEWVGVKTFLHGPNKGLEHTASVWKILQYDGVWQIADPHGNRRNLVATEQNEALIEGTKIYLKAMRKVQK